jgi:hypothetical protein
MTCHELIKDCITCEQVSVPGQEYAVKIGYDIDLSPRKGEYVVCKAAREGLIQNPKTGEFNTCQDLFPGCDKCANDGSQCDICAPRHMSYKDGSVQKCKACSYWGDSCIACNMNEGCFDCEEGYWNIGTGCFKKPW